MKEAYLCARRIHVPAGHLEEKKKRRRGEELGGKFGWEI